MKLSAGGAVLTQTHDCFMEFLLVDSYQQRIQVGPEQAVYTPSKTQATVIMSQNSLLKNLQKTASLVNLFTLTSVSPFVWILTSFYTEKGMACMLITKWKHFKNTRGKQLCALRFTQNAPISNKWILPAYIEKIYHLCKTFK